MKLRTPESGVLKACLQLLAAERIWCERRNTRTMWVEATGKRRPVFFGQPGTADIFATPLLRVRVSHQACELPPDSLTPRSLIYKHAFPLWIECKSDAGRQTAEQAAFQKDVEAAGHGYILARSSDDVLLWLKNHGALA